MNRLIDEHILPDVLVRSGEERRFTRLAAAFARFYFGTEDKFVADFRRQILTVLTSRVTMGADRHRILALNLSLPVDFDWSIDVDHHVHIDVERFVRAAVARVRDLERANAAITSDPKILRGTPVFAGTRVPIDVVTSSLERGMDRSRVVDAYPFLTDELIEAAMTYAKSHPRRGRPAQAATSAPGWRTKSVKVVRTATRR
jgi:uncharacterized protein (DUF433 family)